VVNSILLPEHSKQESCFRRRSNVIVQVC